MTDSELYIATVAAHSDLHGEPQLITQGHTVLAGNPLLASNAGQAFEPMIVYVDEPGIGLVEARILIAGGAYQPEFGLSRARVRLVRTGPPTALLP